MSHTTTCFTEHLGMEVRLDEGTSTRLCVCVSCFQLENQTNCTHFIVKES